jgi:Fibronectin type III domain
MQTDKTNTRSSRRHVLMAGIAVVASIGLSGAFTASASADSKTSPLPTPSPVTVSEVTAQSFKLGIGTSSTKLYSIYLNGALRIGLAQSSQTTKLTILGLTQNTDYTVQVEEVVPSQRFRTSPRTTPITVHTPVYVAPVLPASPTGLQATNVTAMSTQLSWSASPGAVKYRAYVNGFPEASTVTSPSYFVGANTIATNGITTGNLRSGRANRFAVEAINAAGVASPLIEITVTLPGTAVSAPTTPTNLRITGTTNDSITLNWDPSLNTVSSPYYIAYTLYVDGRAVPGTCSSYCFGTTGGTALRLAPGTTYRIGVSAYNDGTSDIAEITATTSNP